MSGTTMMNVTRTAVFALSLFASAAASAHGGGGHGGWHGAPGAWNGSGSWHGGYHGGYHHGRYYHGGGWGWWGPGVVIGAPFENDDYYAPVCQTVRVCNNYGHCWLQHSCY